jgi:hypothetical protein
MFFVLFVTALPDGRMSLEDVGEKPARVIGGLMTYYVIDGIVFNSCEEAVQYKKSR